MNSSANNRGSRRGFLWKLGALGIVAGSAEHVPGASEALAAVEEEKPRAPSFIPSERAPAVPVAEWSRGRGTNFIAATTEALSKAPASAARYEAKTYQFPSGGLRLLTFAKGTHLFHQITFETAIYVLKGRATLRPLYGLKAPIQEIRAGDALFLPSGEIVSERADTDVILLLAQVMNLVPAARASIVTSKNAKQERERGTARAQTTLRYSFEGNEISVTRLSRGVATAPISPADDLLTYVASGRLRFVTDAGSQQINTGGAVRHLAQVPGHWECLENAELISVTAPWNPVVQKTGWANIVSQAPPLNENEAFRFYEMSIDGNNRSAVGFMDVPLQAVSEKEAISPRQPGVMWRIGFRPFNRFPRTDARYEADGGPHEMHVGGAPHFVARMLGHTENALQDGSVLRQSAGDFVYVRPGSLHHSNSHSLVQSVVINLFVPGTDEDSVPLAIRRDF